MTLYDVVLSDPPWSYYGKQDKHTAAAKHYKTIPDSEMSAIAKPPLAPTGVLFMWATTPRLDFAISILDDWQLHYRGIAFIWVKTRKDLVPIGAQGIRPTIIKPTAELVIAASPVRRGRPMPLADESVKQIIMAPKREHSRKPDEIYSRIESLYPKASRLEMFARTTRPGWDAWGDQTTMF